jgi:hypothetical protein
MKLDRNINPDGHGKYALLLLRNLENFREPGTFGGGLPPSIAAAIKTLEQAGVIDWGNTPEREFFVIRLKDKYAAPALSVYAHEAFNDDPEYSAEIAVMALRAGRNSPFCKRPD